MVELGRVRDAIKARALTLHFLLEAFDEVLPQEDVDRLARKAIFKLGEVKGHSDGGQLSPAGWLEKHKAKGSDIIFSSSGGIGASEVTIEMSTCPLLEAWVEQGCSTAEQDRLCNIAMEIDRGRAAYHGIEIEIPMRRGKGDDICKLVLRKKTGQKQNT